MVGRTQSSRYRSSAYWECGRCVGLAGICMAFFSHFHAHTYVAVQRTTAFVREPHAQAAHLLPRSAVIDIDLAQGFKCMKRDEATWAARIMRARHLQFAQVEDVKLLKSGRNVHAQVRLMSDTLAEDAVFTKVPIVFIQQQGIHQMSDSYADLAIETACKFNPDVHVILVRNTTSDAANADRKGDHRWEPPSCAQRHLVTLNDAEFSGEIVTELLNGRMATLLDSYVHRSSSGISFEVFCIARWFILEAFVQVLGKDHVFYADCDVLVFTDVSLSKSKAPSRCHAQVNRKAMPTANASIGSYSGHSSYWNRDKLEALSQFMVDAYNPALPYMKTLLEYWTAHAKVSMEKHGRLRGGVSDMWLIGLFAKTFANEGVCYTDYRIYDHFKGFNDSDFLQDELGLPYRLSQNGTTIEAMKTLHFQGKSKNMLIDCQSRIPQ
jgi:hypothetical protein